VANLRKPSEYEKPLCAEIGGDLFFQDDMDEKSTDSYKRYRMAQNICKSCLHLVECGEWGIKNEYYGIWGGLNTQERRKIRSKRRINLLKEELNRQNIV
jgi:hypothetical protein